MKSNAEEIDVYMREIDRTLLRENLKLTPAQRLEKFANFTRFATELRRAGEKIKRVGVVTRDPKR